MRTVRVFFSTKYFTFSITTCNVTSCRNSRFVKTSNKFKKKISFSYRYVCHIKIPKTIKKNLSLTRLVFVLLHTTARTHRDRLRRARCVSDDHVQFTLFRRGSVRDLWGGDDCPAPGYLPSSDFIRFVTPESCYNLPRSTLLPARHFPRIWHRRSPKTSVRYYIPAIATTDHTSPAIG